jgi:hypothetical protein
LELGAHCSKRGALFDYVRFLAYRGRDTTSSVVLSNPDIHQSAAYGSDVPLTAKVRRGKKIPVLADGLFHLDNLNIQKI